MRHRATAAAALRSAMTAYERFESALRATAVREPSVVLPLISFVVGR